eukprot:gene12366-biopygen3883
MGAKCIVTHVFSGADISPCRFGGSSGGADISPGSHGAIQGPFTEPFTDSVEMHHAAHHTRRCVNYSNECARKRYMKGAGLCTWAFTAFTGLFMRSVNTVWLREWPRECYSWGGSAGDSPGKSSLVNRIRDVVAYLNGVNNVHGVGHGDVQTLVNGTANSIASGPVGGPVHSPAENRALRQRPMLSPAENRALRQRPMLSPAP